MRHLSKYRVITHYEARVKNFKMPVDATTGRFQEVITQHLNSFLSYLIWNSTAMWGLSQSGMANWIYSMAPSMRGEVAEAIRGAMVIGLPQRCVACWFDMASPWVPMI